jgi:hypothetical protein
MMMISGESALAHDAHGPEAFAQLRLLEKEAVRIFVNAPQFVPGLLQRPAYATGLLNGIAPRPQDGHDVQARVTLRVERAAAFEERLRGPNPPQLHVAIDEAVLRRSVGGTEVMRDQIEHLITLSGQDNIHLAIVPLRAGAYPGQVGTFQVHQNADGRAALFLEGPGGDELTVSDQGRVRANRELVEAIIASAVTGPEARHMLEKIAGEL